MKIYVTLGIIMLVIGFFGVLSSSSLFFGLLTSGVFLVAYSLLTGREEEKLEMQISETDIPTPKPQLATPILSFCPNCGAKLEAKTLNCPLCGKRLGEET